MRQCRYQNNMSALKVTTLFYRYRPYANVFIMGYVLFTVLLFVLSAVFNAVYFVIVGALVLILPPILAVTMKKSWFRLRTWDERKLVFEEDAIRVGDKYYPVKDMDKIAVYVFAWQDFRYNPYQIKTKRNRLVLLKTAYGDLNRLSFRYFGDVLDFEFYLPDHKRYSNLLSILDSWQQNGIPVTVKEAFPREFVRRNYEKYNKA